MRSDLTAEDVIVLNSPHGEEGGKSRIGRLVRGKEGAMSEWAGLDGVGLFQCGVGVVAGWIPYSTDGLVIFASNYMWL